MLIRQGMDSHLQSVPEAQYLKIWKLYHICGIVGKKQK